ncbi:MAG: DUF1684 domain-containing protein [Bacteroidota bacterium]|nr:DUF1684 domain-containing protein [Bacteroidota bacterium]
MVNRYIYTTLGFLIISFVCCKNKSTNADFEAYKDSLNNVRKQQNIDLVQNQIVDTEVFSGLRFFEPNLQYVVKAKVSFFEPKEVVFKTNTERSPIYYQIAYLDFTIKDTLCRLTLYASSADGTKELFLPFKDLSNGKSTYGAGRYLEYQSNEQIQNNEMKLDFNLAFNPYCHYNKNYSCPIVPNENKLNVFIHAGEQSQPELK